MTRTLKPEKAKARPWRPNVLIYGEAGTGKTIFALELSKIIKAKTLLIDAERGSERYGASFDFDVIHTDDPEEIDEQIDYYLEHPDGFTCFVIDPISTVHNRLTGMADDELRGKRTKGGGKVGRFESVLDPGARALLKRYNKSTMAKLKRLDMTRIVTARAKPKYKVTTSGGKFSMERQGTTWEGDNSLDFEFDIVIELLKTGSGKHLGRVEKSRGFEWGEQISDFSAKRFVELIGPAATWNAESKPRPVISSDDAKKVRQLLDDTSPDPGAITRALTHYGATCIEDIPREHAASIIKNLENAKKNKEG